MSARIVEVGLHPDGTLRDARRFALPPLHGRIAALRFDATLFFGNASFFEDEVLRLERENPELRYILLVSNGINHIDASGIEMLRRLVIRLREVGITLVISGAKRPFREVIERTGLDREIGVDNMFSSDGHAMTTLFERVTQPSPSADHRPT